MGGGRRGDTGAVHGDPGHHDRQREPAEHRRLAVGQQRRCDLDADLVSGGERHGGAGGGLARSAARTQALFPDLHRDVHAVLVPVRHRHQPAAACGVPAAARVVRRRAATVAAVGDAGHFRALAAGQGLFDGLGCGDLRADHRPGAGRLDHRQLLVALGVPDQRAGGDHRILRRGAADRGSALGTARPRAAARHRHHRARADRAGARRAADHAGSRRGQRLVRLPHHPALRAAGGGGHRRAASRGCCWSRSRWSTCAA